MPLVMVSTRPQKGEHFSWGEVGIINVITITGILMRIVITDIIILTLMMAVIMCVDDLLFILSKYKDND